MKKLILILPFAALFACTNYKEQVAQLQEDKSVLIEAAEYKDSTINSFLASVSEIEQSLREIDDRTLAVESGANGTELKKPQMDRIRENIQAINELMKTNREKLEALNKQMKNSRLKLKGFEEMVASLNKQLEEKNLALIDLNQQLASMNMKIDSLNTNVSTLTAENNQKQEVIEKQVSDLNRAYVAMGTPRELTENEVIIREGGFLGIGKEEKLKPDYNRDAFKVVDITKVQQIPIHAKDAELLTFHPAGSYTIRHQGSEVTDLLINDPDKFWQASRILVVVTDK